MAIDVGFGQYCALKALCTGPCKYLSLADALLVFPLLDSSLGYSPDLATMVALTSDASSVSNAFEDGVYHVGAGFSR